MVNRIWKQLFGQGIVPTPDNFGVQGQRPTHPELLEWLSGEFVDGGWRIKPLVKLMMTSTAYRQASHRDSSAGPLPALPRRSIPATTCSGGCGCGGSSPRSCAIRSWPSAAI